MSGLIASLWGGSASLDDKPGMQPISLQDDVEETVPLTKGDGPPIEKCELRLEGMTCGACVEVRPEWIRGPGVADEEKGNRGHAEGPEGNPLYQSGPARRARSRRVRSCLLDRSQDHRSAYQRHFSLRSAQLPSRKSPTLASMPPSSLPPAPMSSSSRSLE